jgi:hypothetical protein
VRNIQDGEILESVVEECVIEEGNTATDGNNSVFLFDAGGSDKFETLRRTMLVPADSGRISCCIDSIPMVLSTHDSPCIGEFTLQPRSEQPKEFTGGQADKSSGGQKNSTKLYLVVE